MPSLCTVSGNLKDLLNVAAGPGTITFTLTNYSGPVYVASTNLLVPSQVSAAVASNGSFSTSLLGNDNISPTNTLYIVKASIGSTIWEGLYSITGSSFNLNTATPLNSGLPPIYGNLFVNGGSPLAPTGSINSSNTVFTLPTTPGLVVLVFRNGILQQPGGNDYTLSGSTITFTTAPTTGDVLLVVY